MKKKINKGFLAKRVARSFIAPLACLAFFGATAGAGEVKLLPDDGAMGDYFGESVSVSGGTVIVGAKYDDDNGGNSGSAYVFTYDGTAWTQNAKLTPDDGAGGDEFGFSVSISGNVAIVGTWRSDNYSGSAYIFTYDGTTWTQNAKLTSPEVGLAFGFSVSISGDTAIVGAIGGPGSAYIFTYDGTAWTQIAKLTPDDAAFGDHFGASVYVSEDTAIVGAEYDADNGTNSGSAYIFTYDGTAWTQNAKLTPDDGAEFDEFGSSVSVSGDTAIVGAYGDDDNGSASGSAYVFTYDGTAWIQNTKLTPDDGGGGDFFGRSVSVSGDTAVVGARFDDDNGSASGSGYVFTHDGTAWTQHAKLMPDDGAADNCFGGSVSVSGDTAVVGAYGDDDNGSGSGSAYVYNSLMNDAPEAVNDSYSADEDTPLNISAAGVLANDADTEGDALTAVKLTDPSHGALTLNSDGSFTYTPAPDWNGTDSFTYKANDGVLDSDPATVSITVGAVNDAPVISGTPGTSVNEDVAYSFTPSAFDIDSETLEFFITNQPAWASFDTATGTLSGTPGNDDVGAISGIAISVSDGSLSDSLASFDLTVINVNDAPVISGTPSTSVNEDAAYSFVPTATDPDTGDTLTFSITNQPAWASFDTATGTLSGTPGNDDVGAISGIAISVSDGSLSDSLASFNLTVINVNDAPVISGTPSTSVNEDAAYSFVPTVTDPDTGDTLTFSITNQPAWASFDTATGTLSGTPGNDDVGAISGIAISVSDGSLSDSLASFNLTVINVNDAPVISGNPATSVNEDTAYSFVPTVTDPDTGDTLTFSITNQPAWASFDTATGTLSGTPGNENVGTTSGIVISVSDGSLSDSLPEFALTVINVNDSPVAAKDNYSTDEDTPLTVPAPGVLENDTDVEDDPLTAVKVTDPAHGTATLNADGSFAYTPAAGWNGTDSFTYKANDGTVDSDVATVTITVNDVADPMNTNALILDFGSDGLERYDASGFGFLNSADVSLTAAADIDADGEDELIAAISGHGLYMWDAVSGWTVIETLIPEAMIRYNSSMAVDFGAGVGLKIYSASGWSDLNSADPGAMAAVDIDNDGTDELAVSFPGFGVYIKDAAWTRIETLSAEGLIRWNSGLAADFGGDGIKSYDAASGWQSLSPTDPDAVIAADVDSDGLDELAVVFSGFGLYLRDGGWTKIEAMIPEDMIRWADGIAVDFGAGTGKGLKSYDAANGWQSLNSVDPDGMVSLDVDNDGVMELAASFPGYGVFVRDAGWTRIDTRAPENMTAMLSGGHPDSDADGLPDDWETHHFGDISRGGTLDADSDGLSDADEYWYHTDPANPDTDGDGLPDGWEADYNLNPILDDAGDDPDGDGFTNFEEYNGGTDPWGPASFPVPASIPTEIIADFGAADGLERYASGAWTGMSSADPGISVAVDCDADGKDELFVSFPGYGLYIWDAGAWTRIETGVAEGMIRWEDGIAADFGSTGGLKTYNCTDGWKTLSPADPDVMAAADVDEDGADELAVSFPAYGLYIRDSGWTQIETLIPENLLRLNHRLVVDFGADGLKSYDVAAGWKNLSSADPGAMVAADMDEDGSDEMVVSFPGYGLYYRDTSWTRIETLIPEDLASWNNRIAADFGGDGLKAYDLVDGWRNLSPADPDGMIAADIENADGAAELIVAFPGYGLYSRNGGWTLIDSRVPEGMIAADTLE